MRFSSLAAEGAIGATSFADLVTKLAKPRTVWVMLPAGEITEAMVTALAGVLDAGDTISVGGNTFWMRRGMTPKGAVTEHPVKCACRSQRFDKPVEN
jgi:6-phosphogluconate dehydrogenase (decarboxylating)